MSQAVGSTTLHISRAESGREGGEGGGHSLGVSTGIFHGHQHDAAHKDAGLEQDGSHADDEGLTLEEGLAQPQVQQLCQAEDQEQDDLGHAVVSLDGIGQQGCDDHLEHVYESCVCLKVVHVQRPAPAADRHLVEIQSHKLEECCNHR